LVSGSSAPGAITSFRLSQVRRSVGGWCANALQKLLIQSVLQLALMSSNTARTSGPAARSSTSGTVCTIYLPIR
jgi:hypothetical protein